MTQTLDKREDPLNLGGGWASSSPLRPWRSCHRKRRGAPIYKRRQGYGPKVEYEPPRKQPKYQYGSGPWFQPPQPPAWALNFNWGSWCAPWHPPPTGFRKPPGRVVRMYGLHPFCLCCCSCWGGPWNPGWARPPGRKKRWGRRGRGLRRQPRGSSSRSPPVDLSTLLRPVNLYGWRAPGMQAPPNTTQFIMDQIYQDMQQQEELERQQRAQAGAQASPACSSGNDAPPSGGEEDAALQALYGYAQNPSLALSPAPEENQSSTPQLLQGEEEQEQKMEEEEYEEDIWNGRVEESEEEEDEAEEEDEMEEEEETEEEEEAEEEEDAAEEDEAEEEDEGEEDGAEEEDEEGEEEEEEDEEEGLEEEQREEENHLPLEMPLSILVGAEEESENFINCTYLSPK
ncbi:hypothetical protein TREES_T100009242 [Tupaia chinensis]|uniref:Coiled-coil domain-containing glutamate-rich protein 1 n=1 Tax=Tupaia chinensis TaxID=246437 RepID=L9KFK8_TUPCH|nr:hypothetical protein TREES_T100009242 [Tupaia chinensis]